MQPQQQPRTWPVRSGTVPFLADGFTWRSETGAGPWDALLPGHTVTIGPPDPRTSASRGGTGKTQLAAGFAARLWAADELDLLVWLDAGSRDSIVSGYAKALADIRVAAQPGKPEAAATRFLTWLSETGRRWLIVLDGLTDYSDADGLWPHGPSGQVLVTTALPSMQQRRARPALPGPGTSAVSEQLTVTLPGFSQREALAYLSERLNDDPYQVVGSLDLAIVLECMPAGLSLAVSYLLDSGLDCRQYGLACERYKRNQPGNAAGDPLAPCWMLAVDRVRQFGPAELAWPALKLAAVLGPARIPGAVLTSPAACAYITGRPRISEGDQASIRLTFANLQRLGLITIKPEDEVRTVAMPAALQASVRQAMGETELRRTVVAAASAVCESWPEGGRRPDLNQALRDCAISLQRCDDQALWSGGCHPLLARAGRSLDESQMPQTALIYWVDTAARSAKNLGQRAQATLAFRDRLAAAAATAGRNDDAVILREELAADSEHVLGAGHPQAIAARAGLALAYRAAGRSGDAMSLAERVAADSDLVFGPAHPQTLERLRELGGAYADAGSSEDAISTLHRCLGLCERTIGPMHPETISVRGQLAEIYRSSGRPNQATRLYQDALAQAQDAAGAIYPDAVSARESLALALYQAGHPDDAAAAFEQAISEWQRIPGTGPAATIAARSNLAAIYCGSGKLKEAIQLYESEVSDLELTSGPSHARTLRARWNLAAAYHKAKRLPEAIKLGEITLADCEQALGPGDRETLSSRANLAHAYHAAGQLKRASAHFDRALRDCEQSLGPDDQLTEAVRALRKRYLAGRQGAAPIITPPGL